MGSRKDNLEPTAFGISAKTAKALADPLKIRILVEVTVSPLSPSEFVEAVGGDLSRVSRCFRQLARWGYLEVLEERLGRRGGASIERVYRARRRAHFDNAAWEAVPRSERDGVSRSILSSYHQRIREAIEAGTFDKDVDRHLSWDAVALDRIAWAQLGACLDEVLGSLEQLELEATDRLVGTSACSIPTVVGLAAFRANQSPSQMLEAPRNHIGPADNQHPGSTYGIDPKLAKALANRWKSRILMEASIRPISASQFVEEIGGSMGNISRCFRELANWGYLELVEERRGGRHGGGIERIYKSTCRPYFDTSTWEVLPQIVREEISDYFLETYFVHVTQAIETGTFDAEVDRHLSWMPVSFDRKAWLTIGQRLDEILAWTPELEAESVERVAGDTGLLIPTVVGLMSFRVPA